jgi:hypothetical protein
MLPVIEWKTWVDEINGGTMNDEKIEGVPQNCALLCEGDQSGYKIKTGFSLELEHGLWGYFPAIYRVTQRIVVAFDEDLIHEVWKTLSPRGSVLNRNDFYVNEDLGVCYPLPREHRVASDCKPMRFLTKQQFDELMKTEQPFQWAPGLVGNGMTEQEFVQAIEAAA